MDDDRLACIGLASKGYAGGDPDRVAEMAVETVLDLLAFERYRRQYEETSIALARKET